MSNSDLKRKGASPHRVPGAVINGTSICSVTFLRNISSTFDLKRKGASPQLVHGFCVFATFHARYRSCETYRQLPICRCVTNTHQPIVIPSQCELCTKKSKSHSLQDFFRHWRGNPHPYNAPLQRERKNGLPRRASAPRNDTGRTTNTPGWPLLPFGQFTFWSPLRCYMINAPLNRNLSHIEK